MSETKPESMTSQAYDKIRSEIILCRLKPNDKLIIADLCDTFKVSLGAVREALSRLTSEGLVISIPRKGFRVADLSQEELIDLTDTRIKIELMCIENSITNGDLKWESGIVSALFELSKTPIEDAVNSKYISPDWTSAHKRFHESLVAACDSKCLLTIRENLYSQSERYRQASVPLDVKERDIIGEHSKIADAALEHNVKKTQDELERHLHKTTSILIKAYAENGMF
ncbi:MAG: GntR family transcriptional regulator [OCS116 cluster bacterium]|nr:GntR family transcriptional regulator [OCS116 cluster bacterium]